MNYSIKKQLGGGMVCRLVFAKEVMGWTPTPPQKFYTVPITRSFGEGHVATSELATCPLLIGLLSTNENLPHNHTIDQYQHDTWWNHIGPLTTIEFAQSPATSVVRTAACVVTVHFFFKISFHPSISIKKHLSKTIYLTLYSTY